MANEPLHISELPKEWSETLKLDYSSRAQDVTEVSEQSQQALDIARQESLRNDNQDRSISSANSTARSASDKADRNSESISIHVNASSAHGATGDVVGNQNYAQQSVGGVVLLADKIAEITPYSAQAAPAAYDQVEEEAFRQGIQAKLNDIINKVNEIIQGQVNAKQMDNS